MCIIKYVSLFLSLSDKFFVTMEVICWVWQYNLDLGNSTRQKKIILSISLLACSKPFNSITWCSLLLLSLKSKCSNVKIYEILDIFKTFDIVTWPKTPEVSWVEVGVESVNCLQNQEWTDKFNFKSSTCTKGKVSISTKVQMKSVMSSKAPEQTSNWISSWVQQ